MLGAKEGAVMYQHHRASTICAVREGTADRKKEREGTHTGKSRLISVIAGKTGSCVLEGEQIGSIVFGRE
jgi:hypothetical protein